MQESFQKSDELIALVELSRRSYETGCVSWWDVYGRLLCIELTPLVHAVTQDLTECTAVMVCC